MAICRKITWSRSSENWKLDSDDLGIIRYGLSWNTFFYLKQNSFFKVLFSFLILFSKGNFRKIVDNIGRFHMKICAESIFYTLSFQISS